MVGLLGPSTIQLHKIEAASDGGLATLLMKLHFYNMIVIEQERTLKLTLRLKKAVS